MRISIEKKVNFQSKNSKVSPIKQQHYCFENKTELTFSKCASSSLLRAYYKVQFKGSINPEIIEHSSNITQKAYQKIIHKFFEISTIPREVLEKQTKILEQVKNLVDINKFDKTLIDKRVSNFENIEKSEIFGGIMACSEESSKGCFLIDNIPKIENVLKTKFPDEYNEKYGPFFASASGKIISNLTPENYNIFLNASTIDKITARQVNNMLETASSAPGQKIAMENLVNKIKTGKNTIFDIPTCKHSTPNQRIVQSKNYKMPEYEINAPKEQILSVTKNGEVVGIGDDAYIKTNDNNLEKLKIDLKTYKTLFPEYESLCMQQGEGREDCYFLIGGLFDFMKKPNAKASLLKMVEQDGKNIIITIPEFKDYPVKFKNGELHNTKSHLNSSKGMQMFEQAYALAKYASKNKIDTSAIDVKTALDSINMGRGSDVYNELIGTKSAFTMFSDKHYQPEYNKGLMIIPKEKMTAMLEKYANADGTLLSVNCNKFNQDYDLYSGHIYGIESVDKKNKIISIVDPYNTSQKVDITYEQFEEHFGAMDFLPSLST